MALRVLFLPVVFAALLCVAIQANAAEDVFYVVPIAELPLADREPLPATAGMRIDWRLRQAPAYARLDDGGEVYLDYQVRLGSRFGEDAWGNLALRAPAGRDVSGTLYLPGVSGAGRAGAGSGDEPMVAVRFTVDGASDPASPEQFYRVMELHYLRLLSESRPGAAWFRHQARKARQLSGADPTAGSAARGLGQARGMRRDDVTDAFELFTGGRAISENLQLDRALGPTRDEPATVELASLQGITVRELDWDALTASIEPKGDALAAYVPEDQHAVFFPSFEAMVKVLDEAAANGTPVLRLLEPRTEDAKTRERYERQLALRLDELTRRFGGQIVDQVAMTGSDPYLRTGSDVAVLLRSDSAELLEAYLTEAQAQALAAGPKAGAGRAYESDGGSTHSVTREDRALSSYVRRLAEDVVVVTNSQAQLRVLVETAEGAREPLASSPEYRYLRDRYPAGTDGEAAFLMLTDATIRRWCSPRWRIAAARRTRAAAVLSELEASRIDSRGEKTVIPAELVTPDLGELAVNEDGARSSVYGTTAFLTPIRELTFDKVTESEAEAYRNWRRGYERNWQFFDPIALRFVLEEDRLGLDLTVMPLIIASDYNEWSRIVRGAELDADAGDRHAESLYTLVAAINLEAPTARSLDGLAAMVAPGVASPLSWVGDSLSFYVDDDPIWQELDGLENWNRFVEANLTRLPMGLQIAVKSPLKVAAFLAGARAFIQQSAPGMVSWENRTHGEVTYVRIAATEQAGLDQFEDPALYYATLPGALTISFSEPTVRRAIDRSLARSAAASGDGTAAPALPPLLGKSVALQVSEKAVDIIWQWTDRGLSEQLRARSWAALPILNEWRRRYGAGDPAFDPLRFHEDHWRVALVCPGGGDYVWNETWGTMESTVYGHPGAPKSGPGVPPAIRAFRFANFGLTLEELGLRARAELSRKDDRTPP